MLSAHRYVAEETEVSQTRPAALRLFVPTSGERYVMKGAGPHFPAVQSWAVQAAKPFKLSISRAAGDKPWAGIATVFARFNFVRGVFELTLTGFDESRLGYLLALPVQLSNFGKGRKCKLAEISIYDLFGPSASELLRSLRRRFNSSGGFCNLEDVKRYMERTPCLTSAKASTGLQLGDGEGTRTKSARRQTRPFPRICALMNSDKKLVGALVFEHLDGGNPTFMWLH